MYAQTLNALSAPKSNHVIQSFSGILGGQYELHRATCITKIDTELRRCADKPHLGQTFIVGEYLIDVEGIITGLDKLEIPYPNMIRFLDENTHTHSFIRSLQTYFTGCAVACRHIRNENGWFMRITVSVQIGGGLKPQ